ncbi:MAG: hypothetical protein HY591_02255, partial [Candidatus Omnitrophica bacterium]|nr:hypothetical protein [Candidatus Omnitrophota bacterium]
MIKPQIKERSSNIVLIGDFNPHIFQPAWFVSQKLIGIQEGESAKVEIVHSDLAIFSLEWLRLEVTRTRLLAVTRDDRFHEILKDLIVGTFSILSHTPVRMMGINNTWECIINDEETWHNVGHRLAPKDIWNKVMDNPGPVSYTQ